MLVSRRMKDEHTPGTYQRVQYVCGESVVIYLQGSGDAWFGEFGKAPGPQWHKIHLNQRKERTRMFSSLTQKRSLLM